MRVGMNTPVTERNLSVSGNGLRGRNLSRHLADTARKDSADRFSVITEAKDAGGKEQITKKAAESGDRIEAVKVYEAAMNGGECPIKNLRSPSKVPYGHLAKDGVIEYKGVVFVCDERTNSICLGDMTDEKKVLNITLSGGGHLKVNRDSIGLLSKAIGMFSPEDVNLILRAIHQDTKIQSMQKEIEDLEAGVGEQITSGGSDAGADTENGNAVKTQNEESSTDTQIIVNPDGSRTLMVTMNIGGMESTMSLEISKPTSMANDSNRENTESAGTDRQHIESINYSGDNGAE